jgi:hypothetical protein
MQNVMFVLMTGFVSVSVWVGFMIYEKETAPPVVYDCSGVSEKALLDYEMACVAGDHYAPICEDMATKRLCKIKKTSRD